MSAIGNAIPYLDSISDPVPHWPNGIHLLADFYGAQASLLGNIPAIETLLVNAARAAGARILERRFHSFGLGLGITGVVLLAESHISIHTWPEHGFAAADIFMCGTAQPQAALEIIAQGLGAQRCESRLIQRGCPEIRPLT